MRKWSHAIVLVVLAVSALGARASGAEAWTPHVPSVRVHVRTEHCLVTGGNRPMKLQMMCT